MPGKPLARLQKNKASSLLRQRPLRGPLSLLQRKQAACFIARATRCEDFAHLGIYE